MDRALGAIINTKDNRDIPFAKVAAPKAHPPKNITDISFLPVEDQLNNGSCVGQAEGKGMELFEYRETGKFTRLSKRFLYAECKKIDGYTGEGTSPRVAAKVLMEIGIPKESLIGDDNSLSHSDYIAVQASPAALADAKRRKAKGYAFCYSLEDIKTAVDLTGFLDVTIMVGDWQGIPLRKKPKAGAHRILVFGYEDIGDDTKIYFRNSWGPQWAENGDAWFMYSDYEDDLYDMMVYTDLPNELIEEARATPYEFVRIRRYGNRGPDIIELQKRLSKENDIHGIPCYDYRRKTQLYFGLTYGINTVRAVSKYQVAKELDNTGILNLQTIESLNKGI